MCPCLSAQSAALQSTCVVSAHVLLRIHTRYGGHALEADMRHIVLSYGYMQQVNILFMAIEIEMFCSKVNLKSPIEFKRRILTCSCLSLRKW